MDLGIHGRRAIVCGASKGLSRACPLALAAESVEVTMAARRPDTLRATDEDIHILGLSNGARSGLTGFVAGRAHDGSAQRHDQRFAARAVRDRSPG